MRRFFESFTIWRALPAKSSDREILQPLAAESLAHHIGQTVSNQFHKGKILQTLSVES